MAEVDTSFYKAQPPTGFAAMNPLQLFGLAREATQFGSDLAVNEALKRAQDPNSPTGVNKGAFVGNVLNDPRARLGLPRALQESEILASSGFERAAMQTKLVADAFGTLATKKDLNAGDLAHVATIWARNGVDPKLIGSLVGLINGDPKSYRSELIKLGNMAGGYGRALEERPGAPGLEGEPRSVSAGEASYDLVGAGGAPAAVAPVAPAAPAAPGRVVGAPLGTPESSAMMQRDFGRASKFNDEMVPLTSALKAVEKLGPGGTAPGSKWRQEFQSFVYGMSPTLSKWLPGVDIEKIKTFAEADKYLTQAVMARASSYGHGTDMQLATTASGNPNVNINDVAVKDVLKMSIALRRMEHAQTLDSAKSGPVGYSKSSARWATGQDPRAYMVDMLTPEQLKKLNESLKGKDREKFNRSLRSAVESGAIVMPGG